VATLDELGPVQLYSAEKVVFTAAATIGAELLVVEDLDLELLGVDMVRVGDDELEGLVPDGVQVAVLGGSPLLLAVEVRHHVSAGAALPILGKQVTCVNHLHNELRDRKRVRVRRVRRRRVGHCRILNGGMGVGVDSGGDRERESDREREREGKGFTLVLR